ncbi:MAG: hypothetical protein ACI9HB_000847 [Gammaproteobacteria bacterium]|jgi:hypothetical protein
MTAPLNTAKLGFLLPVVLNPATAAAVGIGLGLLWLLRDDEEEATVEAVPLKPPMSAVGAVVEPLPAVEQNEVQPVYEPSNDAIEMEKAEVAPETLKTLPATISKPVQSEIIRKAMSELGKRSAAARAQKKAQRDNER